MLMIVYPMFLAKNMNFGYVSSLIFILSITTLMQYMFSITYKLFLQANQKIYISNFVSSAIVIINLILTIIIICYVPSIHLVKICSSLVFLIQPYVYNHYVKKHYQIDKNVESNKVILQEKRSGFSQNLAHFINMNTDIMVITIFLSLTEVSVYSIYMLALTALRSIITTGANSYQAALGKYIAMNEERLLRSKFSKYELLIWFVSVVLFSTCLLLINPFVNIYTSGVKDANYYRPLFALIMTIAQFFFSARESYRYLILAGGKFKETNFGAIMEAVINIFVSIVLVHFWGIIGVAVGTLIAIVFRLIYFIIYLKNNIIFFKMINFVALIISSIIVFTINIIVYFVFEISINNFSSFFIWGIGIFLCELVLATLVFWIVYKQLTSHN
ncbi:hypothetical protein SDC9_131843 [bioreactor metagenome]|uniref:Uncharacterized protein n=1 Tax=bioreactor metagenome TaxID=1076179 RepID=A0A645D6F0_9ZZZZ